MNNENCQWYVGRYRYQELKNFCLQYPDWLAERESLKDILKGEDPTGEAATRLVYLKEHIEEVIEAAKRALGSKDRPINRYCLVHVITHKDPSPEYWDQLGPKHEVSELYRKFFWHLDKIRK